jgi:DNA-binding PadR family transcriptional regulator
VYPALAQLEDEGLVRSRTREGESGRLFEITDAGREQLSERGERTAPWEPRDGESHEGYAGYRRAIAAAAAAAWQVAQTGDEAQLARGVEILDEARRQLYRLLAGEAG